MKFNDLFGDIKPLIGMIHTNHTERLSTLELAKREIEIYLEHGVYPLIENYFGQSHDCEDVLAWMQQTHPDAIYGVNILGDYCEAFRLAKKYGAKFIQIDSVSGHLPQRESYDFSKELYTLRKETDIVLLGGVRFKYQPVRSGRSLPEDLYAGSHDCDAVVCTGEGTGLHTPIEKVEEFRRFLGTFPIIVGAGVTYDTIGEVFDKADGAIVGSWLKDNHRDTGLVSKENVAQMVNGIRYHYDDELRRFIMNLAVPKRMMKPRCFEKIDLKGFINETPHSFFFGQDHHLKCDLGRREFGCCNLTLFLDDFLNSQHSQEGTLYLTTGEDSDVHKYVGLLTLEMLSSGVCYLGSFKHQGMDVMALRIHPMYQRKEIIVPSDPFFGFTWYIRSERRIHTHPLPTEWFGARTLLNFAVCGEFNLDIFYIADGSKKPQYVFSKGFCCK